MNIKIPALAERPDDIGVLAEHFVKKYAEANGISALPLGKETQKALSMHTWPGNVRELENTIHRAVLLASGEEIGPEAVIINESSAAGVSGDDGEGVTAGLIGRTVADVERDLIIDTLQHCLGNRTHAANILGISIRTLRNKLKRYGDQGVAVPSPGEAERLAP